MKRSAKKDKKDTAHDRRPDRAPPYGVGQTRPRRARAIGWRVGGVAVVACSTRR
ncbi:MAG: hypothetical protein R2705_14335 [Ilumatobacteraceae bacterium]